eukprot:scaffold7341_cov129-Isochrysis_galbana.AAC.4
MSSSSTSSSSLTLKSLWQVEMPLFAMAARASPGMPVTRSSASSCLVQYSMATHAEGGSRVDLLHWPSCECS